LFACVKIANLLLAQANGQGCGAFPHFHGTRPIGGAIGEVHLYLACV